MQEGSKVIIVGAGLSGCTLASMLKAHHDVTVVDPSSVPGGLCKTLHTMGNGYEFGPHILHSDKPEVIAWCKSNFSKLLEVSPSVKACPHNNVSDLYDYPLTVNAIVSLPEYQEIIMEIHRANPDPPDLTSLESFIIMKFGDTLYRKFFENYNIKQWGIHPSQLSAEWGAKRLQLRKDTNTLFHGMWSCYPEGGFNCFFSNLISGCQFIQASCTSFVFDSKRCLGAKLMEPSGSVREIGGNFFVSTIPLDVALRGELSLAYRGVYKSFALIDRPRLLDHLWYTFPNHNSFTRIVEYKHYTMQMSPRTVVSAAFPYNGNNPDPSVNAARDDEFKTYLMYNFGVPESSILEIDGLQEDLSYPIITDSQKSHFESLLVKASQFDNFVTFGRLGLFSYIPMHICIKQAMRVRDWIENFSSDEPDDRLKYYKHIR